jgi:hypothetical protein
MRAEAIFDYACELRRGERQCFWQHLYYPVKLINVLAGECGDSLGNYSVAA